MKRLIGCLLTALIGTTSAVSAVEDDFNSRCGSSVPPQITPGTDTGVVIVDAALRAYVPVEMMVDRGIAVLSSLERGIGSRASRYQCTELMVIPNLPPGRYRLVSLEGQVSSMTLPQRFLYPMPGDGYQVVNPHDWRQGPQTYRVQLPRLPELEVEVKAGAVSYLGQVQVLRNRGSSHAVKAELAPDAARERVARQRMHRLAGLPPAGLQLPTAVPAQTPDAPPAPAATDATAPASPVPAAAQP
ncbi:hypothetical protein [Immundisolibacter sp.]|uniref:hypothetical protein n=1 Tax=Immundisolibacter sp. TaxID=1934948 RepID=UPI00356169A0